MDAMKQISTDKGSLRYHPSEQLRRAASMPWKDATGAVRWSPLRIQMWRLLDAQWFDMAMAAIIIFNLFIIVTETDVEARCYPAWANDYNNCPYANGRSHPWIQIVNLVLLCIYSIEASIRIYVERMACFKNRWNLLDLGIVVSGWITLFMDAVINASFLRVFRVFRLVRAIRVFVAFRELYLLMTSFVAAFKTILWGSVMMFGMLLLWAILMVQFVHPVNSQVDFGECERCGRGHKTVMASVLTMFQQIVAGDSWGTINVPLLEQEPVVAFIVVSASITVALGLTNLILAVIVERAAEAREKDLEEKLRVKEEEQEKQKLLLFELCKKMDGDQSGSLDLDELLAAYEEQEEFRNTLELMDIAKDELGAIFQVLDTDRSGQVDYKEFCDQLHQIRTRDTRTMLTFLKVAINEVREEVHQLVKRTETPSKPEVDVFALERPGGLLASIDDRLERLLREGLPQNSHNTAVKPFGQPQGLPPRPVAPPRPGDGLQRAEAVIQSLQSLGSITQELAGLKGGIARRLEEQVATLTRQAGALASMGVSVQGSAGGSTWALPEANRSRVSEKLLRLRENMQYDLQELLKGIDARMEDAAAMLARNAELLSSMSTDLGCRPPARQSSQDKLGGFGQESKAEGRCTQSKGSIFDCTALSRPGPRELLA